MTAISAASAIGTLSNEPARTVLLPGSPATYANRAVLREMGLRWDPARHRWHGTTTAECVKTLREQFRLEVRCFGVLEKPTELPREPSPPKHQTPVRVSPTREILSRDPVRHFRDSSRTCFESRIALPSLGEDGEEVATPTRRFTLAEISSGLPDDSREEDEKTAERHLRELRARVKVARAVLSTTPGLAEILASDWRKAARFYARFGITEGQFRHGVSA